MTTDRRPNDIDNLTRRRVAQSGRKRRSTKGDPLARVSLGIRESMVSRLTTLAETHRIGINELIRHCIGRTLDQIDQGDYVLPVTITIVHSLEE